VRAKVAKNAKLVAVCFMGPDGPKMRHIDQSHPLEGEEFPVGL
jgi:hypothetical protein